MCYNLLQVRFTFNVAQESCRPIRPILLTLVYVIQPLPNRPSIASDDVDYEMPVNGYVALLLYS